MAGRLAHMPCVQRIDLSGNVIHAPINLSSYPALKEVSFINNIGPALNRVGDPFHLSLVLSPLAANMYIFGANINVFLLGESIHEATLAPLI